MPFFFLTGLCFAGPAILVASLARSYDYFNYYVTLLLTPMFIFCGVFYPARTLPDFLQPLLQALPLTHAIALVRPLASTGQLDTVWPHVLVLSAYALAGYYLAVVLVRRRLIS